MHMNQEQYHKGKKQELQIDEKVADKKNHTAKDRAIKRGFALRYYQWLNTVTDVLPHPTKGLANFERAKKNYAPHEIAKDLLQQNNIWDLFFLFYP